MDLARYVLRKVDRETSPRRRRHGGGVVVSMSPLRRRQRTTTIGEEPLKPLLGSDNDGEYETPAEESFSFKFPRIVRRNPPSAKGTQKVSHRGGGSVVMKNHHHHQQQQHCRPQPDLSLLELTSTQDSCSSTSVGGRDDSLALSSNSSVSTTLHVNNNNNNNNKEATTAVDPCFASSALCLTVPPSGLDESTNEMEMPKEHKKKKKKKSKKHESKKKKDKHKGKIVDDMSNVVRKHNESKILSHKATQ